MSDGTLSDSPPEFDPFSDEYFNDPYDLYRRMRDESPVYFNEKYGFWALFRYDDVCAAHKDWQTFSSSHGVDLSTLTTDPEIIKMYRSIIMMDPPEHDRLRALVNRVFTPRSVGALEPMVREVITSCVAPFDDAETSTPLRTAAGRSPSRSSAACWVSPKGSASRSATGWTSPSTGSPGRWTRRPKAFRPPSRAPCTGSSSPGRSAGIRATT